MPFWPALLAFVCWFCGLFFVLVATWLFVVWLLGCFLYFACNWLACWLVVMGFFAESLILAQDERWRRA